MDPAETVCPVIKMDVDDVKIGLKHVVICDVTFFCDARKVKGSFSCMKKVLK